MDLTSGDALAWLQAVAGNPVLLGLFVFGLVASVKRSVEQKQEADKAAQEAGKAAQKPVRPVSPKAWRLLAFVVGLVASLTLHATTGRATFGQGWLGAVPFGLLSGLISIIGRDGLKTVASWVGLGGLLGVTAATAAPAGAAAGPLPPGPGVVSETAAQTTPQLTPVLVSELRPATQADLTQLTGMYPDMPLDRPAPAWLDRETAPELDTGPGRV